MRRPIAIYDASLGRVTLPDGTLLWTDVWGDPAHSGNAGLTVDKLTTQWRRVDAYSESECVTHHAVLWLLSRHLHNGGNYSGQAWRRIRAQRTRARASLSLKAWRDGPLSLAWGIGGRLMVRFDTGDFTYHVGQSENEELTNVMRRLVDPSAHYVK